MSFLADVPDYVPVFVVLALILVLFVWDRFRYEAVALGALVVLVLLGTIDPGDAFSGLGHPAVITVAAVLVISQALVNAGVVDTIARPLTAVKGGIMVQVTLFTGIVALLSAFMNNVGALALLMPVAIKLCKDRDVPPSKVLMPMAFGSLLGGLMTAIGTPPNLIVAQYRARLADQPFAMFDFTPVGVAVAIGGVAFLGLLGWRLLPKRDGELGEGIEFNVEGYRSEILVPEEHVWVDKTLREVASELGESITLLTVMRGEQRIPIQHRHVPLRAGDVLWVEAEADALKSVVEAKNLTLGGRGKDEHESLDSVEDVQLVECVVLPDERLNGQTASSLNLRWRYGINLLAVSRQGKPMRTRLSRVQITAGDVLILEGERESLGDVLSVLGCLPLADRDLRIGNDRRVWAGVGLFGGAIAVSAVGWVPIHISFVTCVLIMAAVSMISSRDIYRAIDWPIIFLLAAMIPVGTALETSGGAELIANALGGWAGDLPPVWGLAAVLVITMTLSDIVNNAAAAVLMCPIAAGVASSLGVATDPFLMAVAIGASCAFLTPVGHQSNTLVLGPGGYRFRDYWPLGMPLQIIVGVIAMFMILLIWPLE